MLVKVGDHRLGRDSRRQQKITKIIGSIPLPLRGIARLGRQIDGVLQLSIPREIGINTTHRDETKLLVHPERLLQVDPPPHRRAIPKQAPGHTLRNQDRAIGPQTLRIALHHPETKDLGHLRIASDETFPKTGRHPFPLHRNITFAHKRINQRPGLNIGRGGNNRVHQGPRQDHVARQALFRLDTDPIDPFRFRVAPVEVPFITDLHHDHQKGGESHRQSHHVHHQSPLISTGNRQEIR